jgi:hypothetical protein
MWVTYMLSNYFKKLGTHLYNVVENTLNVCQGELK